MPMHTASAMNLLIGTKEVLNKEFPLYQLKDSILHHSLLSVQNKKADYSAFAFSLINLSKFSLPLNLAY